MIRAALHSSDWQQTDWAGDNPHRAPAGEDWAKLHTHHSGLGRSVTNHGPWGAGYTGRQELGETSNLNTFITLYITVKQK